MPGRLSDLVKTAAALEEELGRFEHLAEEAARSSLDSQKGLERARRRLQSLADAENVVNARAGELAGLLGALRKRQEAAAEAVIGWAAHLQARIDTFLAFRERFTAMAAAAVELQQSLRDGDTDALAAVQVGIEALAEQAEALSREAAAAGFRDVETDAIAQCRQLQTSARRLAEVRMRLA